MTFWLILFATIINSLVAFIGAIFLLLKESTLKKILFLLVGFSAGALLSGSLYHLLAESLENLSTTMAFSSLLFGFIIFFLIEKFLHWHHCHEKICKVHPYSYLIIFGDAVHNFIDGLIIAASFIINPGFGLLTTIIIISHEVPQELGDFGVMVHGGMEKKRAIFYNFLSQAVCIAGGVVGWFFSEITGFVQYILPIAAGGFLYISASDLIPELHKEIELKKSMITFMMFVVGMLFVLAFKTL
ncbi:MAG: ZIP family metal transporter [Candidatus Aenigmatarchaeota archaeon]